MNTKKNDKRKNGKEQKIVKIAALCFALISWVATAKGMKEYVFSSNIEASLISFGIQSILFVFNLRLPYFIEKIGSLTQQDERKRKRSGHGFKWTNLQKIVVVFYSFILLSSTFFSFVYICNTVVYEHDIGYSDDDTLLLNKYQIELSQVRKAIDENSKVLPLIASEQLAQLLKEMNNAGLIQETDKSLEELNSEFSRAKEAADAKQIEYNNKNNAYVDARKEVEGLYDVRFWKSDEYNAKIEKRDELYNELEAIRGQLESANQSVTDAQQKVENYKPSTDNLVAKILSDFLKRKEQAESIDISMDELISYIADLGRNNAIPKNYTELVHIVHNLNNTVNQYMKLRGTSNDDSAEKLYKELERRLEDNIKIPDPQRKESFQEEKNTWIEGWIERYQLLKDLIWRMPTYSSYNLNDLDRTLVDKEFLMNYNPEKRINELNDLERKKLTDINVMERAFLLLFSKYKMTAWISFLIAFGLDISSLLAGAIIYWMDKSSETNLENT